MSRNLPSLCDATVTAQVPDQYRLIVTIDLFGGQIPYIPVDVLTHGPRDAVRGRRPPLPQPGTRGLVAFTRGDDRTGRWLGAQEPAQPDASTMTPGQGNVDYAAHYDGGWSWRGPDGTVAEVFADGSRLLLGTALPAPTRHIVQPDGQRVASTFTAPQRNPSPPGAMPLAVTLANGFSLAVTAAGSATFTVPAGQTLTLAVAGGATATLTAAGWEVTGVVVAGAGTGDQVGLQTHRHGTGTAAAGTVAPTPGT
jgi:hypothetical protein